jgi:hypothetical protein
MKKILVFFLISASLTVRAQQIPADTSQIRERIRFIQEALEKSEKPLDVWWYGWLGAYSAATVAQGAIYFLSDDNVTKQDMLVGAATTLLGAGFQLITPIGTGRDADSLAKMPEKDYEQLAEKLQRAEKMLEINALKEKSGRSWQIHGLNTAVNLGSGLITWLAYKRTVWDGVANFLINSVITETQIWTQPTRTKKARDIYQKQYKSSEYQVNLRQAPQPEVYLQTFAGGVAVKIVF